MTTDAVTALLKTYLFADLTRAEIAPLARAATRASFRAGEAVYQAGDAADAIYVVLAGHLKETIANADGAELVTELLTSGDVFGEVGIFSLERDRIVSIDAIDDAQVLVLSRRTLLPYLLDHPPAMMRLLEALAGMIRESVELAAATAFVNIKDRVALRLAELADLHGTEHPAGVLIDMQVPQSLIASLVGASRTNVNPCHRRTHSRRGGPQPRPSSDRHRPGSLARLGHGIRTAPAPSQPPKHLIVTADPATHRHVLFQSSCGPPT